MGPKVLSKANIPRNVRSPDSHFYDVVKTQQEQKLPTKDPLPPIIRGKSQQSDEPGNVEVTERNSLPLKLFDGKKQSLNELNAESIAYIWQRRIKEIFLHMNIGRDGEDDPFVEFDMSIAKTDLEDTCDRYIENERITLTKQIKPMKAAAMKDEAQSANDEQNKAIALAKKQEWDMKNLYAEVFKMSYRQNRLRTQADQDQLMPTKTGDNHPNFVNAIWWYSCDRASIYYQINSIVRLENFELLMSYRYYLSDLCRLIEFMYQKRKKEEGDIAHTFYRADNINVKQLKMVGKTQKNQFISLLGFISTTSDIEIAKGYARKQRVYENNERVLFVISVKPQLPCTAFAYIDRISFHPEEKEVLFSMGSSFIVENISEPINGENYYTINLTASEIDKSLVEDIRAKIESCSPSGRAVLLARYLVELGEYRAARKYLTALLTQAGDGGVLVNDISLAGVYSCLGMTYMRQCLHGDALKAFKQALNTQARLEYSNNNALAEIHNNIGLAYVGLGHLDEAEATFDKATRMQLREPKSNQQYLASIYGNIGYVHYKQKRFDDAEKSFKQAEKIYKQNSSRIVHDALEMSLMKAEFLTNYGHLLSVHKHTKDNRKPHHLYHEALKIYKNILPDDDPKVMRTYINIILAYAQSKSYSDVTKCSDDPVVQKLIEKQEANMFELNSSITQATLGSLYELLGACYASQGQFDKAIQVWKDAYVFERKARLEDLLLVTTDNNSSILTAEHNRFIHEWYRKTANHYTLLSSKKKDEKQEKETELSTNLCLGLLYVKLHNQNTAIECLNKATVAQDPSDEKVLFVAYLLLADIFKRRQQHEAAITNFDQALKFIEPGESEEDAVLEVEVKLARIDCHEDKAVMDELKKLERSVKLYGSDTKYVCLKVIVYDTLARYYLMHAEYEKLDYAIEKSVSLKQNSLSQYHPSLGIDFIFGAQSHVQQAETLFGESADIGYIRQSHYREALASYERALEVYNLNFSNNNLEVRKIYYAMGNILCDMDKLPNAMEKYDVAESSYSELDEDSAQLNEGEDSEDPVEIWMARASMHQHLAEYHARKNAYGEAIVEMTQTINIYSQQLPSSSSDTNDNKMHTHDFSSLLASLHHLAQCYAYLGDILGSAQDDEDGYFMALEIFMKLVPYNKMLEKEEAVLYRKLSDYHENLGEHDEALECFQKAIHLEETSVGALYKLGRLYEICNKPDEAVKNYRILLAHPSICEQKQLKQIVQDKLDAAQKIKKNQNWQSKSASRSSGEAPNTHITDLSNALRQSTTTISAEKSIDEQDKNVNTAGDDSFDYRAMAVAYLSLQDFDVARKFFEKDIKQRIANASDRNIFKTELEKIEQTSQNYNQRHIFRFLPKLLHSLVNQIQKIVTLKNSHISTLADSLVQCAAIHVRFASHMEAINAYVTAFGLYAFESESTNNQLKKTLMDIMTNLLQEFMQCKLKPQDIIDTYVKLSLPNEANQMRLQLLALHRDNEIEDFHGLGGTSHESRTAVLQHYKELLTSTDDTNVRGVCYYNILRLYKHHLHPDQQGKDIVNGLVECLPKLNIWDQRLLAKLSIDFLREYHTASPDEMNVKKWQISAKTSINNERQDSDEPYIGLFLFEIGNLSAAEGYWRSIIKQIESSFSSRVLDLIYDSDVTFKEIVEAGEHFERDSTLLYNHLATAYENIADYSMQNATSGRAIDRNSFVKAVTMYKKAINLLERLNIDTVRIGNVKKKQQEAENAARK